MVNIALLALPQAMSSSLSLPLEMLNAVADQRRMARQSVPRVVLAGDGTAPVTAAGGLSLQPDCPFQALEQADLIIVPSRWRHPLRGVRNNVSLLRWLKSQYQRGASVCAVGTGSYVLAEAGLLDGRPATTHWHYFDDFAARYPDVRLIRNYLITEAERLYCAGSINSIADLIVHIIGETWGTALAHRVERQFSPEIRRPFHSHAYRVGQTELHRDEAIAMAQSRIGKQFSASLSVAELARDCGLSARTFQRRFRQATGQSALQYLNAIRLNHARDLLQASNLPVCDIAQTVGIADNSYFCRLFKREFGETPLQYRERTRGKLFSVAGHGGNTLQSRKN